MCYNLSLHKLYTIVFAVTIILHAFTDILAMHVGRVWYCIASYFCRSFGNISQNCKGFYLKNPRYMPNSKFSVNWKKFFKFAFDCNCTISDTQLPLAL